MFNEAKMKRAEIINDAPILSWSLATFFSTIIHVSTDNVSDAFKQKTSNGERMGNRHNLSE